MSRYGDYDGAEYNNAGDLWQHNARLALKGKRGQKALRELREALLALPEKRLIERALCTVGVEIPSEQPTYPRWEPGVDFKEFERQRQAAQLYDLVSEQGTGVCAVGAYVWWQKVKAGADPSEAFAALPLLDDESHDMYETAQLGNEHGLTITLAWELAYKNDETFGGLTPEERYERFLGWIDAQLEEAA